MAQKRRSSKADTPIDAKQRALMQQQEALIRKQKELERLLQEAPGLKKMVAEKRREESYGKAAARPRPMEVLPGRGRHLYRNTASASPRKLLRVERREAQLKMAALLVLLAVFAYFLVKNLIY
jgi:hypothetical protein